MCINYMYNQNDKPKITTIDYVVHLLWKHKLFSQLISQEMLCNRKKYV